MPKLDLLRQVNESTGTRDAGALSIRDIPVGDIFIIGNVRTTYDGIDELKASITQHGLLQPITVYKHGDGYAVKTGHRRYMAVKELHKDNPDRFHSIRCIISDGENIPVIQLIENVQRENLSAVDLYNALKTLKAAGLSLKQIADAIGKAEQYVKDLFTGINIIDSDKDNKALLSSAGTTIAHFKETKGIKDKAERIRAIKDRAAGRVTRKQIREASRKAQGSKPARIVELKADAGRLSVALRFKDRDTYRLIVGGLKDLLERHDIKTKRG